MKNYFLIPLTSNDIYYNDKPIRSILNETYPELVQREIGRIDILYSDRACYPMPTETTNEYNKYIDDTKKMYNKMQIPQFLIAYGDDNGVEEILTKGKVTATSSVSLIFRRVTREEAEKYYNESSYLEKLTNFFNLEEAIDFSFYDRYTLGFYIEGAINGENIKGEFTGIIIPKQLRKNKPPQAPSEQN